MISYGDNRGNEYYFENFFLCYFGLGCDNMYSWKNLFDHAKQKKKW